MFLVYSGCSLTEMVPCKYIKYSSKNVLETNKVFATVTCTAVNTVCSEIILNPKEDSLRISFYGIIFYL